MITPRQRRIIRALVWLGIWRIEVRHMRTPDVFPRLGTRWLHDWIVCRQPLDSLHHAPCCPANHYHRTRIVFYSCTCGACEPMSSNSLVPAGCAPRTPQAVRYIRRALAVLFAGIVAVLVGAAVTAVW